MKLNIHSPKGYFIRLINKVGPVYAYDTTNVMFKMLERDPNLTLEVITTRERYDESVRLRQETLNPVVESAPVVNKQITVDDAIKTLSNHFTFNITLEDIKDLINIKTSKVQKVDDFQDVNVEEPSVQNEFDNVNNEDIDDQISELLGEEEEETDITQHIEDTLDSLKPKPVTDPDFKFWSNVMISKMSKEELIHILRIERNVVIGEDAPNDDDDIPTLRKKVNNTQRGYRKRK